LSHHDGVWLLAFSPDGQLVVTRSGYRTARLWQVTQAGLDGDPRRITLWVQVITGLEVGDNGVVRALEAEAWHERRRLLQELGGPPLP
jgi:WD40 repeat protein